MPPAPPISRSASQVRRDFIEYFEKQADHTFVPSSPVVPHDDPTLLFTNAGMNQFKDVFLGTGTRSYTRAVNSQKCIRAGGKHNDLEDVGRDTYHHTFFEMLGNWSFGDYFKADAITWAWDLLTNVWGLDPSRLHATYFQGDASENLEPDTEARELWLKYLPAERIHPGNKKDNFWEMGDSGPCGPCSEIHYDGTPHKDGGRLVNAGDPNVIEIWNLVFIQFNRGNDGKLTPLPAKHVDTGMGFERIVRVLQHKTSNYDTDVWMPIFAAIEQKSGATPYRGKLEDPVDIAYRVVADHIRCLTMAITDGARPSNEGRGYVLRRILRRAERMAHQYLNVKGPFLCELVPAVVNSLGEAFSELRKDPKRVAGVIKEEEEAFIKTLDRGLALFSEAVHSTSRDRTGAGISAADAFKLHDTFGFPIDLTRVMAEERGLTVDVEGFEKLMEEARDKSRAAGTPKDGDSDLSLPPDAIARLGALGVDATEIVHRDEARPVMAKVKAIWNGSNFDETAKPGRRVAVILDRTCFYAEQGGQVGDTGELHVEYESGSLPVRGFRAERAQGSTQFSVEDTQSAGPFVLHIGRVTDRQLHVGDQASAQVEHGRRQTIRANHTATHLLNLALRDVLGDDIHQKGSLVAPDRLRFDFSHGSALSPAQFADVEARVNAAIAKNLPVHAELAPLEKARAVNSLRAVFGERYPDPVRVVSIGAPVKDLLANPANPKWREYSIEFCGGTHLKSTGEAKRFVLQSETALAAGVRRILALTGPAAQAADMAAESLRSRAAGLATLADDLVESEFEEVSRLFEQMSLGLTARQSLTRTLDAARERIKTLRKGRQSASRDVVVNAARTLANELANTRGAFVVEVIDGADKDTILAALDVVKARLADKAVMLLSADEGEGKVMIAAAVPKPLIAKGLKAGDWVKTAAVACGGGGGGKPDLAQAGGKDPARTPEAVNAARVFADKLLA